MMSYSTASSCQLKSYSEFLDPSLAASITRAASRQTYYTIRYLVDRDRVSAAYQAYAYFRWVDDRLDQGGMDQPGRLAFIEQQRALVERCYRGDWPQQFSHEESMLVDLIRGDYAHNSSLQAYICNMMAVMAFDAERQGRLISHEGLSGYTRCLATAVTEALHFFIGHNCRSPQDETRYLAVTAAHITHMLRDTLEDIQAGYYNLPRELIESQGIDPQDASSDAYRRWVQARVRLARVYFQAGRDYLAQVENFRCRMAGYAYTARFEGVLDAIEQDGYRLRSGYSDGKSLRAGLSMGWVMLSQAFSHRPHGNASRAIPAR